MPVITNSISNDLISSYDGFDSAKVGIGLSNPDIYKTKGYAKKKIQTLMLGSLSSVVYSGMEHDSSPLILSFAVESSYNTILAYNLHYIPKRYRIALLKYVLESNVARIKSNLPIIVDYHSIKKFLPASQAIVRRYKQTGLRVVETYPLTEWGDIIKESSRWENLYKDYM
ncbi:MAG: hypothetical protein PF440_05315 [Thiomicrorhabdus sp.]|jgi:hypothetical protein|nr:hypothetical protein [Thiomicrorhabdus sp.]